MGFAHLTLATRDVSATKTFFETALGWPAIYRPGNIDVQAAWLQVGCSCSGFGRRKRRVCNDSDFVILYDLTI